MFIPQQIDDCIFIYLDKLYQFTIQETDDGDVYSFIDLDLDTIADESMNNTLLRHLCELSLSLHK